jgi:hypothetical protein
MPDPDKSPDSIGPAVNDETEQGDNSGRLTYPFDLDGGGEEPAIGEAGVELEVEAHFTSSSPPGSTPEGRKPEPARRGAGSSKGDGISADIVARVERLERWVATNRTP